MIFHHHHHHHLHLDSFQEHQKLAEELAHTCYLTFARFYMKIFLMLTIMYHRQRTNMLLVFRQPTFLAPEISYFNYEPGSTKVVDSSSPRTFEQDFDLPPTHRTSTSSPTTLTTCWGRRPWRACSISTTSQATRLTKTGAGRYSRYWRLRFGFDRKISKITWISAYHCFVICRASRHTQKCQEATQQSAM